MNEWENKVHTGKIETVIFSPKADYIASLDAQGKAKLWQFSIDKSTNKVNVYEKKEWSKITKLTFSPDYKFGQLIATADKKGVVCIWDMEGQKIAEFKVDGKQVNNLKFSPFRKKHPEENYIVAADENGHITYWEISGLDELVYNACDWLQSYFSNHPDDRNQYGC